MKRKLYFDIEKSPEIVATYEKYESNTVWKVERSILFSIAWAYDDGKVECVTNADFPAFKKNIHDDYGVTKKAWELLNQPDLILIGHNSDNFDIKVLNTYFVLHGFPPVNPNKTSDSLKLAKKYFRFFGNSLDDLAEFFGIGSKFHKKKGTDKACFEGSIEAYKEMKKYNKHDVALQREVYKKLAPSDRNTPHVDPEMASVMCGNCKSTHLQSRGKESLLGGKFRRRYQCQDCGKWKSGPIEKLA